MVDILIRGATASTQREVVVLIKRAGTTVKER